MNFRTRVSRAVTVLNVRVGFVLASGDGVSSSEVVQNDSLPARAGSCDSACQDNGYIDDTLS